MPLQIGISHMRIYLVLTKHSIVNKELSPTLCHLILIPNPRDGPYQQSTNEEAESGEVAWITQGHQLRSDRSRFFTQVLEQLWVAFNPITMTSILMVQRHGWSNFCSKWEERPGHRGSREVSEKCSGMIKVWLREDWSGGAAWRGREQESPAGNHLSLFWTPEALSLYSLCSINPVLQTGYLFVYVDSLPTNTLPRAERI